MDHHKFKSKWENNGLIFDKDCGYDGISWRQRNFMCNFCKKEYKSAQALGGHMNVHRRDRARLRLSSPSLDHPHPNPNFSPPPWPIPCLPYKTYHASLFPLSSPSSTTSKQDKQEKLHFLGDTRKNADVELSIADANGCFNGQENECRVLKKRETFRVEMEMGLLRDGKIEMGLDLELRLGRS